MPRRPPEPQLPLEGVPFEHQPLTTDILVFRNSAGEPIAVPASVVTMAERAYRCYEHRLSGMSWSAIADLEGYVSASSAAADVRRYTEEAAALVSERSQREMLQLEVARLDELQRVVWPSAMAGSLPAVDMVRKLIADRANLLKLDAEKIAADAVDTSRTVVVQQSDDGYVRSLKAVAGE